MSEINKEDPSRPVRDFGHVASGVGHHVINAFAAVVSNAEILKLTSSNSTVAERETLANTIIRAALDASAVARRMIDYSRPYTDLGDKKVDLSEFVSTYVEQQRQVDNPRIQWKVETEPVPLIPGDRVALFEMLDLLFQNSIEATPDSRVANLGLRVSLDHRKWISLEISDDGQGMDAATQERALEPFFSTKPSRLGVGLTIANGIWRRHRGMFSLRSCPGGGTMVRLCIDPTNREHPQIVRATTPTLISSVSGVHTPIEHHRPDRWTT